MSWIHRRWTVLCAAMLFAGLFAQLLGGAAAAQSVAPDEGVGQAWSIDSAAWTDELPRPSDQIGSLPAPPQHAVADDISSVFHIGPYGSGGVPVSKDIYKNAGETEDHFDGRCANAFKSFTQLFPPDHEGSGH